MKVPIKVTEIETLPDGSAKIQVEYDDDVKAMLMRAWGLTEWDESIAQKEFLKAIREGLKNRENEDAP